VECIPKPIFKSMLPAQSLIDRTLVQFPRLGRSGIAIDPIEKGGSDRKYYRIRVTHERSLILVKYGSQREENRYYVQIAKFLHGLGVHVPEIYFHDEREGLIWMEDLGEEDLWCFRHEPWEARSEYYRKALDQAFVLHTRGYAALPASRLTLQKEFTTALYRWEQDYFLENCLGRFYGLEPEAIEAGCNRDTLMEIAKRLGRQPRVLVHRDFQSQNILIHGEEAHLIDFQGLRPGLRQYDLASLLYDPYVTMSDRHREELVQYYKDRYARAGMTLPENFDALCDLCAMQRLMQALGAYGFLGIVKERAEFLKHIAPALASLRQVIERIPGLDDLRRLVDELPLRHPHSRA
jgi:aminoglycoside/choline kinase family phosphotransferase